jgi:hypothetical protein
VFLATLAACYTPLMLAMGFTTSTVVDPETKELDRYPTYFGYRLPSWFSTRLRHADIREVVVQHHDHKGSTWSVALRTQDQTVLAFWDPEGNPSRVLERAKRLAGSLRVPVDLPENLNGL